jgi:hypothetical protein
MSEKKKKAPCTEVRIRGRAPMESRLAILALFGRQDEPIPVFQTFAPLRTEKVQPTGTIKEPPAHARLPTAPRTEIKIKYKRRETKAHTYTGTGRG